MNPSSAAPRRSLLINAVANWSGLAAQLVVGFFLSPILVHRLGDQRYGIWSLIESFLAYLMLFDFGVAAAVVRYVARFEATKDQDNLNRVFSTSLCIFAAAGTLALLIAGSIAWSCIGLGRVPEEMLAEARWMVALLGFNLAVGLPLSVFPNVLDGLGRYPAKTIIRTTALLVRAGVFLMLLSRGAGLIELAWTITACNLAEHLVLAVAAHCYMPGLRFSLALADRTTFRTIRGYSLDAFLNMVAGRIAFQTGAIIIYLCLGTYFIAFFIVGTRLLEYAKSSLRAVTAVLMPAVSSLQAQGDEQAIRRVFLNSTRYVIWLILPVHIGLFVLGKPFLSLWMGPRYAAMSFPVLAILAIPLTLTMSQSVSARVLYGTGRTRWISRLSMVDALANLALSLLLVQPLGIQGVAWGTCIPDFLANLTVAIYICRTLDIPLLEYLRTAWFRPLLLAPIPAVIWLTGVVWVESIAWPSLLVIGTAGLLAYAVPAVLMEFGWHTVLVHLQPLFKRLLGSPAPGMRGLQTLRGDS